MRKYLLAFASGGEFAIVVGGASGLVIFSSVWAMLHGVNTHHSEGSLTNLIFWKLTVGTVLVAFLAMRGWTARDIAGRTALLPRCCEISA